MSLPGMMRVHGSVVDVFRPTFGPSASGFKKVTWPASPQVSAVDAFVMPLTAELADRVFGSERKATLRVMLPLGTDVAEHDGLKVTSGRYLGKRYQVVGQLPYEHARRSDHIEVAVLETTEAF